jgi:4-diphosphocytidyl-2-C-methyl-D-erythritol kinase
LFQSVSLCDVLEFSPTDDGLIDLEGDETSIAWDETNLIHRAAKMLQERFKIGRGVRIQVKKRIPPGKGLGGGSSNAAVTLYSLCQLWDLALGRSALSEIGRDLGADVPYFLEGGLCLGLGRGDRLQPLRDFNSLSCVLVLPRLAISTASIYRQLPEALTSADKESRINQFLTTRNLAFLENRLEETIFRSYPQLKGIKSLIQSHGAELSLVTGSGSAVFGLFWDGEKAERACRELRGDFSVVLAKTISRDRYWESLNAGV